MRGFCSTFVSPLGDLWLAATGRGLCGVFFDAAEGRRDVGRRLPEVDFREDPLETVQQALTAYFEGRLRRFDLPLDLRGSPFERAVWLALLGIPYGTTRTYGQLARGLGRPAAARAVGRGVGRNPVSIVVPCHRVVGRGGSLVGYGGGLDRKAFLLRLEGVAVDARSDRGRADRGT